MEREQEQERERELEREREQERELERERELEQERERELEQEQERERELERELELELELMIELKQGVIGYLILEDVLNNTNVVIDGVNVDAIVNVLVIQEGSELIVDDITIDGKMLDLSHLDGTLEYRLTSNADEDFMTDFYDEIERIAINKALDTPEDFWDYRME